MWNSYIYSFSSIDGPKAADMNLQATILDWFYGILNSRATQKDVDIIKEWIFRQQKTE